MTNNDILKKLRVALQLRDDQIVEILGLVDFKASKSEVNALFRNEDHPKYVECQDQLLRNFLNGLVIYKRGPLSKAEQRAKKEAPAKQKSSPHPKEKQSNSGGGFQSRITKGKG